ncbi:MAG: aminotransferase class I/II-fold pyridoxal phosphate-dependent enzyme [Treponema sp.]|jgi:histidinol-phosphate/aromatic aminotransferase/cobyric acid decarboxylase-like protein/choline kinase|nr:aminotransferase class I/II-fold pyridoxal phosphate-dependent enzyme [Treponema sp.]
MQAVILAAGMGSRLGKYTKKNTKCMLQVNGRTLIERSLDALDNAGIRKCVIVAGYEKDNLINFVGSQYKNIKITWIINEIYHKTNNIYSLYLAKDHLLSDDTLLLESDLIFEDRIVKELLENPEPTLAVVAPYEPWMDGTVVQITEDKNIAAFIPKRLFNFIEKDTYHKTVNIYKFSRNFSQNTYIPFLEAYSSAMGNNEYYEQVLRVITTLDKCELKAFILNEQKWYEIDDVQDKDIAEIIFSNNAVERFNNISARYGGYWRFPKLLDFCYLVNPYFPPQQMRNEMKACFDELLTEYPSGLNVQNLLMAKLFNLEPENTLTGNGAAELIRAVSQIVKGKVGIIYPTFNEYPESFTNNEIVPFYAESMNYSIKELIDWSEKCDMLVLINPDNPSGNFIPCCDIIRLLEKLKSHNKRLLLDESFVDFCDIENETFLRQEVIDEFPNLLVIKSLSKSYGIPGLRLGTLVSGDRALIQDIRRQIPIWNINSFAEYFLQIIGKYTKEYRLSCYSIAEERKRFYAELKKIGLFMVYPSQANYFLCKLREGIIAKDLAYYLLDKHEIFIKDLTGKNGFFEGSWIRIAIRNKHDNDVLIEKLMLYKQK